jgi:AcrR family transcriptional regulator
MSSNSAVTRPRGRPRNPEARAAIVRAARELLDEVGLAGLTIEAVAARSGISKPTIYRSWPNAQALAMTAFLETTAPDVAFRRSGSAIGDLRAQLRKVAETFATRTGRNVAAMMAAAQGETELSKAFRNHFILESREEGRRLLARGIESGDLRADLDVDIALDLIYAPLYFRLLVGHGALDSHFTDGLLEQALKGMESAIPRPSSRKRGARERNVRRRGRAS